VRLKERLYYLLDKVAADSISPGELDELNELLKDQSYDELAEDHLLSLLRATAPMAGHSEERWQAVLRGMREGRQVTIRSRWWAAAAVLIGAVLSVWLLTRKPVAPPVMADRQTLQKDRAPGGNVAILTLGDGKSITLDSARDGVLAEQGNASVTKSGDGVLAYRMDKGAAGKGVAEKGAAAAALINRLSTPRGGQYRLLLPDGSQVWLNAASSISYPTAFTDSVRGVTITGEAYFEIAPNASMPFVVKVDARGGQKLIRVLGTHFNVNAYNDEQAVSTTLLEGSVRLESIILKPGEQGQWRPDGSLQVDPRANVEEAVAWKNGMFHFEQADLPEIMRQLARWYDVDVEFRGKTPASRFDGEIPRSSNLTEVFKILQLSNVQFVVEDKKVIVGQ
jgi:ferric-dicitrate binding protein FerR (iron transport regulator)